MSLIGYRTWAGLDKNKIIKHTKVMHSSAKTVSEYLDSLTADRRAAIEAVRQVILDNLPEGYVEVMNWGMITYEVPLEIYPDTYNKKPLMYAALASQKNYMAVYLCGLYCHAHLLDSFKAAYKKSGKKLDMGKSCVRFKRVEDLDLVAIGKVVAAVSLSDHVTNAQSVHIKK